jgi:hypothetical protein
MDRMSVTVGGLDLELGFNFGAGREISQKVGDPLAIAREAALEAMMNQAGIIHQPKWVPTVENVPMILFIGCKHGGMSVKLEEVQDAVFRHGFLEAKVVALDYLAGIVTPSAREKIEEKGGDNSGE